ncbi:DUF1190 domain-containing protein [Caulobacter sp.]|uniref:DUF1190 domain-containing protein n=1 Tax=Caulobacter sp. TaxID=78 RepID=UPI002B45C91F|nr:DUF1190 domain-containing protein [Caulobacter sp.]HJV43717.1 DUF1190 domain-containing protein [Caulobacter sp.]
MSTRKRSASLQLTTMLAGAASLTLAGCDDPGAQASWDPNRGEQVEAFSYKTLEECKAANEVPDQQCETSYAAAQKDDEKNAPRYEARASCEDVYGVGNCVPRSQAGDGSFFTPLLAGFVIGRMLDGGGGYYRGTGLYRGDDGYYSTWGGRLGRDYGSGRTVITRESIDPPDAIRNAPPKVQTRTSVVSRGGFGGGRSYAHSSSYRGGFGG